MLIDTSNTLTFLDTTLYFVLYPPLTMILSTAITYLPYLLITPLFLLQSWYLIVKQDNVQV